MEQTDAMIPLIKVILVHPVTGDELEFEGMLDTGASHTTLSKSCWEKIKFPIIDETKASRFQKKDTKLKYCSGRIKMIGNGDSPTFFDNLSDTILIDEVDYEECDLVIGRDILRYAAFVYFGTGYKINFAPPLQA